MWGILELLPPGDESILPLEPAAADVASEAATFGEPAVAADEASLAGPSAASMHHVVTASGNSWIYRGRRSGEGENEPLRIEVAPGDTVEFRQSDGRHGVFFYETPKGRSELGRSLEVGAKFDVESSDRLKRLSSRLFERSALTTEAHKGRSDIVSI
jgi:plastocyanin